MGLSRSARIMILLVIDVLFFFVELIAGYAVGSLALVADSFHMLNDVLSLIVGLYAIKLTASTSTDPRYSYGWHRAEILAALINGVFLLALCFSISLEALERFFNNPEVSNPELIIVVGSLGLVSNIIGLFLLHEHSHSPSRPRASLESPSVTTSQSISVGEVSPTKKITIPGRSTPPNSDTTYSYYGHPATTRASLFNVANEIAQANSPSTLNSHTHQGSDIPDYSRGLRSMSIVNPPSDEIIPSSEIPSSEETPLLRGLENHAPPKSSNFHESHAPPKSSNSHESSMNVRALVLHVLGDALGNVGVVATGFVIWQTSWSFKYYFDPLISLVITLIIFSSALPLVRSTSFILLQGVPAAVSLEEVRSSILKVSGVDDLHELHIWQLSENKIVASVHVRSERRYDFMHIAENIRHTLHRLGIHSCTIQPEYAPSNAPGGSGNNDTPCLVLCPPDQACDVQNACCPSLTTDV